MAEPDAALPRGNFLVAMAERYAAKTGMRFTSALDVATVTLGEFLADGVGARSGPIEFGDPAFAWTASAAAELVDEDLTHWEAA